ncbi:ATP-binding protein [Polyangium sp. 6x1]|uniref:hybrid sensor histidine kinase/response regulator n=1 Tax=Polyangium sp. 6x1 TaxID=3042689 RepID=UPI002482A7CC|nr:ATP-binding protein [Polyangium sp. 6x1]MDI1449357.1 ATP-binding protein [Polyangium sp. 6x1]
MRIRSHLLLLAFGVILPVAAFSGYLTARLVEREQLTIAQGSIERLRSTMGAIDAQVQGQIMVLRALASARALESGDIEAFQAEAARVLSSQPAWRNVLLAEPDGKVVANVAAPWAVKAFPYLQEPEAAARAARTRAPAVGSMMTAPALQQRGVDVAVPVLHDGQVRYVLLAFIKPDLFLTSIEKQRIGQGWVSGLVDARGAFIARVPAIPAEKAGAPFLAAIARGPEGWYRGKTTEGYDAYTAHITSAFTNWSIGLGIPAEEVLAGARRTGWAMGGGIASSLGIAFLLALWLGRRVSRPVVALAEAAPAIATGTTMNTRGLEHVAEVRTVAHALNEAAAAVRDRQELLEREKRALQEGDRAKDEFIAMMSHELRNPLAALTSASQLLDMVDPQHPAAKHAREVIKRQTKHTARLVEDLLDVSRIVMGKAHFHPEIMNLADAASAVLQTWRASGRLEHHDVTLHSTAVWIRADRARVEQILSNLLDNALKFSPKGSAIEVRAQSDDGGAVLSVADQGPGLPAEMMEHVFDLFVQGEQGLARKSGGMGIGLALVKKLAELQGGSVSVVSAGEERGAVFTVRFPEVSAPASTAAPPRALQSITPRRILLIDDNDDMRKTLAASLSLQGHEVREASDGRAGVELAESAAFDVAVVDLGLPEMDGYEVARRLRANPLTRHIGLVALTGYGQLEDKRKSFEAGFDEHLTKPVDPEALEEAIAFAASRDGSEPAERG